MATIALPKATVHDGQPSMQRPLLGSNTLRAWASPSRLSRPTSLYIVAPSTLLGYPSGFAFAFYFLPEFYRHQSSPRGHLHARRPLWLSRAPPLRSSLIFLPVCTHLVLQLGKPPRRSLKSFLHKTFPVVFSKVLESSLLIPLMYQNPR